jgi:hypothetical protein
LRMASSWMLRRVALVQNYVLGESITSVIRVKRIGGLGTLTVTSSRSRLRRNTSQKTAFFIVTAVRTSNFL